MLEPFNLSGRTKPFAVLGHPIGHTLSPAMHNAAFRALGWDALYSAYDVAPAHLMPVLRAMHHMGFQGVNLTIPHKQTAFAGVDHLAASAELFGAVNTVVFRADGRLEGHNTDGDGILASLRESFDLDMQGRVVLVLGCGGAGRAMALLAAREGAASILLANRSPEAVQRVAADTRARFPAVEVRACAWPPQATETREADLVLQSSSVGMKAEDPPLLRREHFRPEQAVYDLIYVFPQTAMLREAAAAGARTANGLNMLLHQGVRSFEIWTGTRPPVETMRTALETALYGASRHV